MSRKAGSGRAGLSRRTFVAAAGAWSALAWAPPAFPQSKQPVLIGWLSSGARKTSAQRLADFKEGLSALGWKEGSSYVLDERWVDGQWDRVEPLAQALAARQPAIIVAVSSTVAQAASRASPTTPIVLASGDPLTAGLVTSLARPGGMITGLSNVNLEINEKLLELLLAAVPGLKRIGFLGDTSSAVKDTTTANVKAVRRAVEQYRIEANFAYAARPEEIESALARLAKDGAQGLVVISSSSFLVERSRILNLALARRWPIIATVSEFAEGGALLSYGVDRAALFRRAAYYVDRVLKGAKPGDLPIEQPTKFELVVNMKTAKALGLTLPQPFLMRADRVIE